MQYLVTTPWWLRLLYRRCIWQFPRKEKVLYLTFDDGPHPTITPFVLEQLQRFNARATFFCIGNNVAQYSDTYQAVLAAGHRVGNHTYQHVNGWNTEELIYLEEVKQTAALVSSDLFRPPYGRIRFGQSRQIRKQLRMQVVMWSVLSGDFDKAIDGATCANHVIKHAREGSIVVFHDSEKAFDRLKVALPLVLEYFWKQGFQFEAIP